MNTETKKRKLSPAQQLKKELKQQYPLLIVSCTYDTYSMGCSINVDIKNLHDTPYPLEEVQLFCYRYQNVRTYEGEILNGGNRYVHINNIIDNEIQSELDQMFLTYLSIYKGYEYIKTVEYNTLIDLPSKHRETYRKLLGNQSYSQLPEPQPVEITTPEETTPETPQETTTEEETMNTTTTAPDTMTELELNNNIENEIKQLTDKLTARNDLLVYLEKNNINGKIQQATEEEIAEIQNEIEELTAKLDPRPKLKEQIAETKELIDRNAQDIIKHSTPEEIAFFANDILVLNHELSELIKQLAEAETNAEIKTEVDSAINSGFPTEEKKAFIETKTAELVLTAPPTVSPQNVIELFPRKKTLDQLRNELITPEQYQDLIDNFDTYTQEYQNINLHGLQLIRDDYSTKDANGELSPTYDQWHHFMQSYQELTIKLRKLT